MKRREFRLIAGIGGGPSIQDITKRQSARRYFKTLQASFGLPPLQPVSTQWTRSQCLVSPLNSNTEVTDYTTPWVWGFPFTLLDFVPTNQMPIWHLKGAQGISPTTATAGTANPRYVVNMAPVRYRIGDSGWQNFTPQRTRQYLAQLINNGEFAFRNSSPPTDGHSGAAAVTSVVVTPPFANYYKSVSSACKFVRMRVNGTAVSSIVSIDSRSNVKGIQNWHCNPVTIPISPTLITASDVIEFDYWYQLNVLKSEGFLFASNGIDGGPIPILGVAPESWNTQRPFAMYRASFSSINVQAKRTAGVKYKLTFSSNGPGGASELVMQPQTNWQFEQLTATRIKMTKTAGTGTGENVTLDWGREIAHMLIVRSVYLPVGSNPTVRYFPAASGHYGQIDGASTPGVWNATGSTTFSVRSILSPDGMGGVGYLDSSRLPASYFGSFPTTVTVEKV